MNSTGVTYTMIGGPFHQAELPLPHPVNEYKPVKDGVEEEYYVNSVTLFGRRIPALVHSSLNGNEPRVNDALAHALLSNPGIYGIWQKAAAAFPAPDDTRVEPALAETPR